MPTDVYYGGECELRVGAMADADTDPVAWENLPFMSLSVTPTKEQRDRPQLGTPRHNVLDPVKPRPGFQRVGVDLVVDGDCRRVPRWLRYGLGAPTTSGPASGLYTHVWNSGSKTPNYFALQIRTATDQVRIFRGLVLGNIGLSVGGENTQDFDINLGLRGLERERVSDWVGSTPGSMVSESIVNRALLKVDGVSASHTLQASWSWDRQLAEDAFLSTAPTLSGLRPGGGAHAGSARFRAVGEAFDDIEEANTVFAAAVELQGLATGHKMTLEHPQAMLSAPALRVEGVGIIERDIAWTGHQDASDPASRITVVNNIASYAS